MDNDLLIKGLSIDWSEIDEDSYLRKIDALKELNSLFFSKNITIFVGENGSGKSTLLEAIAIAYGFNPEGGTRNYNFSTYRSHSELCDAIRLCKGIKRSNWGYFLRAESFYNVATAEELYEGINASKHYHQKSHGESFLQLVQNNFVGNSLYLLDEPEAALSPQRQLTLLYEIQHCIEDGSQFIIVTHSPILLGMPNTEILSFDSGPIHKIEYEDTDSYKITKLFIENKEQLLNKLLYK